VVDRRRRASASDLRHAAVVRLLDREGARLHAFARRMCGPPVDAEDLVQETFLAAFRARDQLADPEQARAWLYAIARRACQRMHRRRAGEPRRLEPLDALLPRPGKTAPDLAAVARDDPHDERVRAEARELVERGLAELPAPFRMALVLADVAELSIPEIAAVLGIKEATVKTRIHRARLKLRQVLADGLPQRPSRSRPDHARRVCLDLLRAKLDAVDRRAPFPYSDRALCERCRTVLATLDLAGETCASFGREPLPPALRRRILKAADER
jgi:RNA polymerase sigma-70 factor (ECF subfamily)